MWYDKKSFLCVFPPCQIFHMWSCNVMIHVNIWVISQVLHQRSSKLLSTGALRAIETAKISVCVLTVTLVRSRTERFLFLNLNSALEKFRSNLVLRTTKNIPEYTFCSRNVGHKLCSLFDFSLRTLGWIAHLCTCSILQCVACISCGRCTSRTTGHWYNPSKTGSPHSCH